jgi:hypothetical protein
VNNEKTSKHMCKICMGGEGVSLVTVVRNRPSGGGWSYGR